MLNWFDAPMLYYRRFIPMRSRIYDYMYNWAESVDKEMEAMYNEFYNPFLEQPKGNHDAYPINMTNTTSDNSTSPKENESEPQEYYSFSSSMYTGSDGVQHIIKEEIDSKTGKKVVTETKRIGDKSLTVQKVTDKDGKTEEKELRKNIKDDEIASFSNEWDSHFKQEESAPPKESLPIPEDKTKEQ